MVTIGICDDEEESREQLKQFCRRFFAVDDEIREYVSGEQFLRDFQNEHETAETKAPDILLLDIEMAGVDGLEVKRSRFFI